MEKYLSNIIILLMRVCMSAHHPSELSVVTLGNTDTIVRPRGFSRAWSGFSFCEVQCCLLCRGARKSFQFTCSHRLTFYCHYLMAWLYSLTWMHSLNQSLTCRQCILFWTVSLLWDRAINITLSGVSFDFEAFLLPWLQHLNVVGLALNDTQSFRLI